MASQSTAPRVDVRSSLREMIPPLLFLSPAALVLLLFMAVPTVNAIAISFQQWNGMVAPKFVGLTNYGTLFRDRLFLNALGNTAYYTIVTVLVQTFLPLGIATLLNSGIRGSTAFRTLYFMPVIISLAISGLLWAMIYEPNFGILNGFLDSVGLGGLKQLWLASRTMAMPSVIVVSIWQSLGFYLVIYFAALQNIPKDLYEAAAIDGANAWDRFVNVTIPMVRPVMVLVVVLNTINGVKVFDQIWVMTTGGPNHASDTLGTYLYSVAFGAMGSSNPQLGYAAAIGIFILALSLVLSVVQIRLGKGGEIEY